MTTNKYYCYVYYDSNWVAYYVGKGQKLRQLYRQDRVPVADFDHTQLFYFNEEWEAFECERELISHWSRQMDGGTLMNVCLGGAGTPGRKMSEDNKKALAKTRPSPTAEQVKKLVARSSKPISLENISSGIIHHFKSCADAARSLNFSETSARNLRTGYFKTCKGWRLPNA